MGVLLIAIISFCGPMVHAQTVVSPAPKSSSTTTNVSKPETELTTKKRYEFDFGMLIEGSSLRDDNAERRDVVYTAIVPKSKINLTDMSFVDVHAKIKFRYGHIQGATPTNGRESELALKKAEFTVTDANFFRISAGVVDPSDFTSNLLLDTSLPGALFSLSSGDKNVFAVGAFGMGGLPGSATRSDISEEVNKTPSYTAAGLYARFKTEAVLASVTTSSFEYRNLPSAIANDSVKLGNSGLGNPLTPIQTLQYQYRGILVSGKLDWKITPRLEWKSTLAGIRNFAAPNEFNTGWGVRSQIEIGLGPNWFAIPDFSYFNVQPDAVVANFNDDRINTNRVGYYGGLFVQYKKLFKVGGLAGERALVFENPAQGREVYAGISVEVLSASF